MLIECIVYGGSLAREGIAYVARLGGLRGLYILNCELRFGVHKVSGNSLVNLGLVKEALLQPCSLFGMLRYVIKCNFTTHTCRSAGVLVQLCQIVAVEIVSASFCIIENAFSLEILWGLELLHCCTIE